MNRCVSEIEFALHIKTVMDTDRCTKMQYVRGLQGHVKTIVWSVVVDVKVSLMVSPSYLYLYLHTTVVHLNVPGILRNIARQLAYL